MSDVSATAIVVAGGSGERFGREGGKQLLEVAGRPVVAWSVAAMAAVPQVDRVVVVCPEERRDEFARIASDAAGGLDWALAPSGSSRQDSVASGLRAVDPQCEVVIVHDGARPLVRPATVSEAIARLIGEPGLDGVVLGHPSVDTIKLVDGHEIVSTPDRAALWAVQTPQIFRIEALASAFQAAFRSGFIGTDDASVVERNGGRVAVFLAERDNIKVTVPEDAAIAEALLRLRSEEGE